MDRFLRNDKVLFNSYRQSAPGINSIYKPQLLC